MKTEKYKIILLVEDNPTDVLLTREALAEAGMNVDLHVAEDGEAALDFLERRATFSRAPRPDLVLLDLNMPKKDGRSVLADMRKNQNLRRIPVVVLTTSSQKEDIEKSYNLCANCYIQKPVDFNRFSEVVRLIEHFWFDVATLPEN